jgi:hypothetical protein
MPVHVAWKPPGSVLPAGLVSCPPRLGAQVARRWRSTPLADSDVRSECWPECAKAGASALGRVRDVLSWRQGQAGRDKKVLPQARRSTATVQMRRWTTRSASERRVRGGDESAYGGNYGDRPRPPAAVGTDFYHRSNCHRVAVLG